MQSVYLFVDYDPLGQGFDQDYLWPDPDLTRSANRPLSREALPIQILASFPGTEAGAMAAIALAEKHSGEQPTNAFGIEQWATPPCEIPPGIYGPRIVAGVDWPLDRPLYRVIYQDGQLTDHFRDDALDRAPFAGAEDPPTAVEWGTIPKDADQVGAPYSFNVSDLVEIPFGHGLDLGPAPGSDEPPPAAMFTTGPSLMFTVGKIKAAAEELGRLAEAQARTMRELLGGYPELVELVNRWFPGSSAGPAADLGEMRTLTAEEWADRIQQERRQAMAERITAATYEAEHAGAPFGRDLLDDFDTVVPAPGQPGDPMPPDVVAEILANEGAEAGRPLVVTDDPEADLVIHAKLVAGTEDGDEAERNAKRIALAEAERNAKRIALAEAERIALAEAVERDQQDREAAAAKALPTTLGGKRWEGDRDL